MAYGHSARVPGPGLNCAEIHVDLTTGSLSDDRFFVLCNLHVRISVTQRDSFFAWNIEAPSGMRFATPWIAYLFLIVIFSIN